MLLLAGLVAAHQWWGIREERRLSAEVAASRNSAEPLVLFEEFQHAPVDRSENAVVDLRLAGAEAPKSYEDWENLDPDSLAAPLTAGEAARVRRVLERYADVLRHVRDARAKPGVQWELVLEGPAEFTRLPHLKLWDAASVIGVAALLAHHDGDDVAALRHLEDLCFVARAVDRQPFLRPHSAAMQLDALAAVRLAEVAPTLRIAGERDADAEGGPRPSSPGHVREIIRLMLDAMPATAGLRQALAGERARQYDTVRAVAEGRVAIQSVLGMAPQEKLDRFSYAVRHVIKPLVFADGALTLRYVGHALEATSAPDWPSASRIVGEPEEELGENVVRHLLANILSDDYRGALRRHHQGLTNRRLAAAALAARWYATEHGGRLPDSLDALVPRYLPAVPLDPMADARPIGYAPDPARPRVYSVGRNGVDDAGSDAPWQTRSDNPGPWQRLDVLVDLAERPRRPIDVDVELGKSLPVEESVFVNPIPTPPWADQPAD